MNPGSTSIKIPDLTKLDQLELEGQLENGRLHIEEHEETETHGELATATAVVLVSLAALRVIAVWLSKKNQRTSFKKVIEVVDPTGNKRTFTIEYDRRSSTPPEAEVLKQLAAACNVDTSSLL